MGGFKIKVNRTYSCANVINIDGKDVVIPKGKINPPEGLPLVAPTEEDIMNRRKSLMHKLSKMILIQTRVILYLTIKE